MSASLDNVQVVLRARTSISPDVKAVNLSAALNGVYLTLSLETELKKISSSKKHSEVFKRTVSRLYEMTLSKNT